MLKYIDLARDYKAHEKEYLEAIKACCEVTAAALRIVPTFHYFQR